MFITPTTTPAAPGISTKRDDRSATVDDQAAPFLERAHAPQ